MGQAPPANAPPPASPCGLAAMTLYPTMTSTNTSNTSALIAPVLLSGLLDVDELTVAFGCRFPLDVFTSLNKTALSPNLIHRRSDTQKQSMCCTWNEFCFVSKILSRISIGSSLVPTAAVIPTPMVHVQVVKLPTSVVFLIHETQFASTGTVSMFLGFLKLPVTGIEPSQVGVRTPNGCDASVHTTRQWFHRPFHVTAAVISPTLRTLEIAQLSPEAVRTRFSTSCPLRFL